MSPTIAATVCASSRSSATLSTPLVATSCAISGRISSARYAATSEAGTRSNTRYAATSRNSASVSSSAPLEVVEQDEHRRILGECRPCVRERSQPSAHGTLDGEPSSSSPPRSYTDCSREATAVRPGSRRSSCRARPWLVPLALLRFQRSCCSAARAPLREYLMNGYVHQVGSRRARAESAPVAGRGRKPGAEARTVATPNTVAAPSRSRACRRIADHPDGQSPAADSWLGHCNAYSLA